MTAFVVAALASLFVTVPLYFFGICGAVALYLKPKTEHHDKRHVHWGPFTAVSVAVAIYILAQLIALAVMSGYLGVTHRGTSDLNTFFQGSTWLQFAYIVVVESASVLLVWLFLRRRRTVASAIGLVRPRWVDILYTLCGFAVYFIAYIVILKFVSVALPNLDMNQRQDVGFDTANTGLALVPVFISLVILPPLVEEIVARGVLYSGLRTRLPMLAAAIITSLLFACAHLPEGKGSGLLWVAGIDTFVLSMVLVYLRERTGSLWPGIGLHAIKNGIAFLALFVFHVM